MTTRRTIVKSGVKLAYVSPVVAASFKLNSRSSLAQGVVSGSCGDEFCCPAGGTVLTACDPNNANCYCYLTTEGDYACHEGGQFCTQYGTCTHDSDCPGGTHCSATPGVCEGYCIRGCGAVAGEMPADAGERSPVRQ
jgi:hypothetical protein